MQVLEGKLAKLIDYHVRWFEVDSSLLGSPQVRKRVYIVGLRKDLADAEDLQYEEFFPLSFTPKPFINIADPWNADNEHLDLSKKQADNVRSFMKQPPSFKDGMRRVGQAYLCEGGNVGQAYHAFGMVPTLTKIWARFLPIYFPHPTEKELKLVPKINDREFTPNFRYYGKGKLRRASVSEVMRLQGFPPSFIPHANDRLAYEHAGNAVNAKVVREIAKHLIAFIK